MIKLITIVGTRPELIRLSETIKKCDKYFDHTLVNTFQNFPKNDHRSSWSNDQKNKWVGLSKKLFESNFLSTKYSQAQLCLRFCMSFPEISVTIAGMISEKQVLENTDVLDMIPMNNRQMEYIIKFNKENESFINP